MVDNMNYEDLKSAKRFKNWSNSLLHRIKRTHNTSTPSINGDVPRGHKQSIHKDSGTKLVIKPRKRIKVKEG